MLDRVAEPRADRPLTPAQRRRDKTLTPEMERELTELADRYGAPLAMDAEIPTGFADPIRRRDRIGEVCFAIRRPNGRLLLSIKTTYPRGAHRLPTGGIKRGESVLAALRREAHEETGLDLEVRRFLARITYRPEDCPEPIFHTFAFLLVETGGTLEVLDPDEKIEEYIEVEASRLRDISRGLATLSGDGAAGGVGGSWRDWGRFRAVVHSAVHQALLSSGEP
jgi:8-oxo-dGTP pyrophosphatase MutT (NUDIX family)